MTNYDFTECLSPLDFELLSKDLLEAELGIQLENFSEGRDGGIDLRYAPANTKVNTFKVPKAGQIAIVPDTTIVQCKRYSKYSDLKHTLKNSELKSISKLKPSRYILTTSVELSTGQVDELKDILSPFVLSTGDIYGRERLNSILAKHDEIERRHVKLWATSSGVLESIINAGTHVVSSEEVKRTIAAAKIYVRNDSFDEALAILKEHRVCIISGLPGIGKTTLARMLLLYFHDKEHDIIKIESNISEARAAGYQDKPRFYYYDDFLGQTAQADKLSKNEDQKLLDFIASVRESKESVFVLTTREYILNQAKLHYEKIDNAQFDHQICVIDLTKYSRRIKAQILYNHLFFSTLPRPHLDSLVSKLGYIRIVDHKNYNPRLIEHLTDPKWIGDTSADGYLELFLSSLDNPKKIWGHAFHHQISNRARHLLFALTSMPLESLISDAENAFKAFHDRQCVAFGMARTPLDFKLALKELDGTFVSTRKIGVDILVQFQNPSIRDFMQNMLLGGEQLEASIASLSFFEQAQWFVDTLEQDEPRVPLEHLQPYAADLVSALQRLIDAKSCLIAFVGDRVSPRVASASASLAWRLSDVANAVAVHNSYVDVVWVEKMVSTLEIQLNCRTLNPSDLDGPIQILSNREWLVSDVGSRLLQTLKDRALEETSYLDEFETVANLIEAFPNSFADHEIQTVRLAYDDYAQRYPDEHTPTGPDGLRDDATRIGNVGEMLGVDTSAEQEKMKELADEIEAERASHWDDDDQDDRVHVPEPVDCPDAELHSMFRTL